MIPILFAVAEDWDTAGMAVLEAVLVAYDTVASLADQWACWTRGADHVNLLTFGACGGLVRLAGFAAANQCVNAWRAVQLAQAGATGPHRAVTGDQGFLALAGDAQGGAELDRWPPTNPHLLDTPSRLTRSAIWVRGRPSSRLASIES